MKSVFKSFKRFGNSLQAKVTRATSNEGIGPTNEELVEISIYSYNSRQLEIITSTISYRLCKLSEKYAVSISKTLTLILYLLQNGSNEFSKWLKKNLENFSLPEHIRCGCYPDSIKNKLTRIIQLCQNEEELKKYKSDIHKYRNDMNSPGIKRTSIELAREPEIAIELGRNTQSADIPRFTGLPLNTLSEESPRHSNNPFFQQFEVRI